MYNLKFCFVALMIDSFGSCTPKRKYISAVTYWLFITCSGNIAELLWTYSSQSGKHWLHILTTFDCCVSNRRYLYKDATIYDIGIKNIWKYVYLGCAWLLYYKMEIHISALLLVPDNLITIQLQSL